jgi:hypothetical protein
MRNTEGNVSDVILGTQSVNNKKIVCMQLSSQMVSECVIESIKSSASYTPGTGINMR